MTKIQNKSDPIVRTSHLPLIDLASSTDIPFCKSIVDELAKLGYEIPDPTGKAWLAESRYKGSERIIFESGITQVIELGAGFTPHSLNMPKVKYIEVDFPETIKAKKKIVSKINPLRKVTYISGEIFEDSTWEKIQKHLVKRPTVVFCEGFMQYTNPQKRKYLTKKILPIIQGGGIWFFEDSLTFHPEFSNISELRALSERMKRISKNKQLTNYITQEDLTKELESYGLNIQRKPSFNEISSPDYSQEGKIVLGNFKNWILTGS